MATLTTTRSRVPTVNKRAPRDLVAETEPLRSSLRVKPFGGEAEPLEKSVQAVEAPESRPDCHAEAPDAGMGDPLPIEREFTHGRSRS